MFFFFENSNMQCVNKDNVCFIYLFFLIQCFQRCELQDVSGCSVLMNPLRADLPWPDLLEFATGSDLYIVVKHKILFILGKSNGQSLVSLIYYLFQSK